LEKEKKRAGPRWRGKKINEKMPPYWGNFPSKSQEKFVDVERESRTHRKKRTEKDFNSCKRIFQLPFPKRGKKKKSGNGRYRPWKTAD